MNGPTSGERPMHPALALLAATVAVSWSGPLVRLAEAPSLAVAAWRLVLSVAMVALVLAVRREGRALLRLRGRDLFLAAASGALLGLHLWSWFASVRATSVASAVLLVSTYPFWIGLLSMRFLGERPAAREWLGIGVALAGVAAIGWDDFRAGGGALLGDGLALLSALLVAGYFTIGRDLRQRLDLWSYVAVVYAAAAVVLMGIAAAAADVPLGGYPTGDWLVFLALAAGPTLVGHTGVNYAIRYMPAYVANLAILGEAVGAIIIAWLLPGIREAPPAGALAGGALVLAGIAVGTIRRRRRPSGAAPGAD